MNEFDPAAHAGPHDGAFRHEALLYKGMAEFLDVIVPFVRAGIEAGEPVMVAVSQQKIEALKERLGPAADEVMFVDMLELGTNPARIIPAWRDFVDEHVTTSTRARGVGEPVWPERSKEELEECERHESLLNVAFDSGSEWLLLCPYDLETLPRQALEAAMRSHPTVIQNGSSHVSQTYDLSRQSAIPFSGTLSSPRARSDELAFDVGLLPQLREFVTERAHAAGFDRMRAGDLVLAVNELATNSIRHAGGRGVLRIWCEDGDLVCEVVDNGRITEPLVGRQQPSPMQDTGRGLWLVNHLCDLVQIRSSDEGNIVRLRMSQAGSTA